MSIHYDSSGSFNCFCFLSLNNKPIDANKTKLNNIFPNNKTWLVEAYNLGLNSNVILYDISSNLVIGANGGLAGVRFSDGEMFLGQNDLKLSDNTIVSQGDLKNISTLTSNVLTQLNNISTYL